MSTAVLTVPGTPSPAPVPPAIAAEGLTRVYGRGSRACTAVKGIDLHVAPGEVFGLLGTNGAGKTSTLEMLEGLVAPTRGSIEILGMDPVRDRGSIRRRTGIMLQSGGLPSQLTTLETLTMWAGTCTSPRPVQEVLSEVGMTHRADVRVGALSGGEQRRVDLACALLGGPDLLFLDEPTTGLDPESRRGVWELLGHLVSQGTTVVLTTHYLEEAERLCDRIALMHAGRIALQGTLPELVATASSTICLTLPDAAPELPALTDTVVVEGREGGRRTVTISTDHLQRDTATVLAWARHHDLTLEGFAARPATLETVFMNVTGRTAHETDDPRR